MTWMNEKFQYGVCFGVLGMIGVILLRVTEKIDLEFTFPIMFFISVGIIFINGIFLIFDIDKRLNITQEKEC